jgi:ABC-type sugar transport system substrate-binding protein
MYFSLVLPTALQAKVDIVRVVSAGGYGKVAEQLAQLEQLGTLNLDAVILLAVAYDGYDKVVERLLAKGVKVIAVGTPIGSKLVSVGILQDQKQIGKMLAKFACEQKPKAQVIALPGPPGAEWNKLRFDGFKEVAAGCGLDLVGNTFEGQIT